MGPSSTSKCQTICANDSKPCVQHNLCILQPSAESWPATHRLWCCPAPLLPGARSARRRCLRCRPVPRAAALWQLPWPQQPLSQPQPQLAAEAATAAREDASACMQSVRFRPPAGYRCASRMALRKSAAKQRCRFHIVIPSCKIQISRHTTTSSMHAMRPEQAATSLLAMKEHLQHAMQMLHSYREPVYMQYKLQANEAGYQNHTCGASHVDYAGLLARQRIQLRLGRLAGCAASAAAGLVVLERLVHQLQLQLPLAALPGDAGLQATGTCTMLTIYTLINLFSNQEAEVDICPSIQYEGSLPVEQACSNLATPAPLNEGHMSHLRIMAQIACTDPCTQVT